MKSNAALRLSRLLDDAASIPGSKPAYRAWQTLLGIEGRDAHVVFVEVARLLGLLRDQIAIVNTAMEAGGMTDEDRMVVIRGLEAGMSVMALTQEWKSVCAYFSSEVRIGLRVAGAFLPSDDTLEEDARLQLLRELGTLKEKIQKTDLPAAVRSFLVRQIEIAERGLREYVIRGSQALREASDSAALEWVNQPEGVKDYLSTEPVQEVASIWSRMEKTLAGLRVLGRFAVALMRGGNELLKTAKDVSESWGQLPPGS